MVVGLGTWIRARLGGNQDLSKLAMRRARAGIGYLPQEASIFQKLSIADNILAILQTRKDLSKSAQAEELERLINEFNLNHVRASMGMSVSGGSVVVVKLLGLLPPTPNLSCSMSHLRGLTPFR